MELSMDQLLTYIDCPLKYNIKYNAGLNLESDSIYGDFSRAVRSVVFYFWYRLMNNDNVSNTNIKDKWEAEWYRKQNLTKEDVLYDEGGNTQVKLGKTGLSMLFSFFRKHCDNPGTPICINEKFTAPIGDHIISGNIDLVREITEGNIKTLEIVGYKTRTRQPKRFTVDRDLPLTIQSYAFRHMFQTKEQRLTYYFLRHGKSIETVRDHRSYNRIVKAIDSVSTSIKKGIFYPRDTFMCESCKYSTYCDVWPEGNI